MHGVVTPNMVAPTSGRPPSTSGGSVLTMPAIAAAALARILRRDRVDAGDVGDRRHQRDVDAADVVARVARGHRRDHDLRHAHRQGLHRVRRDRSVAGPARGEYALDAAFVVQTLGQGRGRVGHLRDRRSSVAGVGQRAHVDTGLGADLVACDVRCAARRTEHADVSEQRVHAGHLQAVAQVRVLVALRVERPDQQYRRRGHQRYATASRPPCSADRSIASQTSAAR